MPPRPRHVTLVSIGVLSIAFFNLLRAFSAARQWEMLAGLEGVSPLYIALSGALWAAAGLWVFWGLWRSRRWMVRPAQAFTLAYALYVWADRVLPALRYQPLAQAAPQNWLFLALASLVLIGYAWSALELFRRQSRDDGNG